MTDQRQSWPLLGDAPAQNPRDEFLDPAERRGYVVIIEQLRGSGNTREWSAQVSTPSDTREDARRRANSAARTFNPNHPIHPQGRDILRISPDEYLVIVDGMTSSFHFRVSVAERLRP